MTLLNDPRLWKHHYVVTGVGGVRTDFVAKWLSWVDPWFLPPETDWFIDVVTGSTIQNQNPPFAHIRQGPDKDQFFQTLMSTYSQQGSLDVSKSHIFYSDMLKYIPQPWHDRFTVVTIVYDETSRSSVVNIVWEFFVKLLMRKTSQLVEGLINIGRYHGMEVVTAEQLATQEAQAQYMEKLMLRVLKTTTLRRPDVTGTLDHRKIQYEKILEPGGADHVAQTLDIEIQDWHREIFSRGLALGHSPREITSLGRLWRWQDLWDASFDIL